MTEYRWCETRLRELEKLGREAIDAREQAQRLNKGHQLLRTWLFIQLNRLAEYADPSEKWVQQLIHASLNMFDNMFHLLIV